ncbi:MAG: gamma carbonic anhydrase family protein [Granulosicoccaceae bacterium]
MKYQLGDKKVQCLGDSFIAPNAAVIGDVVLGDKTSVWFSAVIRADNDRITIGEGSNIQECAVLHVDPGAPLSIGKNVTVGHKAMLHGCSIDDGSLIGMNAVVLNGAKIGKNCLIGANALVTENTVVPDNSLFLGSPGKVVKTLDDAAAEQMQQGAKIYRDKIPLFQDQLIQQTD